jgi:hypothetical protein
LRFIGVRSTRCAAMIRKVFTILFILFGVVVCILLRSRQPNDGPPMLTRLQIGLLIACGVVAITPIFSRPLAKWLDRFRHPSPRRRAMFALGLGAVSVVYLICTAFHQHRGLYPRFHDEHAYLLQMRLMSCLRLWTAAPHNPDFFDSFYILVKPVYASIYFPGTALLYTWELWLHAPKWLGPVLVAGAIIALTFRISSELLDDAALGVATALLVLGVIWLRYLSVVVMSHTVVTFLGLCMMWAYLRWRKTPTLPWTVVIGALAGWCAITRPIDAICYAAPVAVAMFAHLMNDRRRIVRTIVGGALSALPFLSLQLIFDKGAMGHWLETPYQFYTQYYSPDVGYGTRQFNPTAAPQTVVLQKKLYDEHFNKPATIAAAENSPLRSWFQWKFFQLMNSALANNVLTILLPIGLLDLDRRPVRLLWSVLPAFIIGYAFFAFLMPYYCVVTAPAMALCVVMGADAIRRAFPAAESQLYVFFTLALATISVTSLNEFTHIPDDSFSTPTMRAVAVDLPRLVHAPAVVLFHFVNGDDYNEEPVYNLDTCNIDDAPIIRAHDLGPRNPELINYYAQHQPDRFFYVFERSTSTLRPLGTARELAKTYGPRGGR